MVLLNGWVVHDWRGTWQLASPLGACPCRILLDSTATATATALHRFNPLLYFYRNIHMGFV